jgi:hypothetical protein
VVIIVLLRTKDLITTKGCSVSFTGVYSYTSTQPLKRVGPGEFLWLSVYLAKKLSQP